MRKSFVFVALLTVATAASAYTPLDIHHSSRNPMSTTSIAGGTPTPSQIQVKPLPSDVLLYLDTREGRVEVIQRRAGECSGWGEQSIKVRRNGYVTCAAYGDDGGMIVNWPNDRTLYNVNDFNHGPKWLELQRKGEL